MPAKMFEMPDPCQLTLAQYRSVTSELVGSGLFTHLGSGLLVPCWMRLAHPERYPDGAVRLHYANQRRLLGK